MQGGTVPFDLHIISIFDYPKPNPERNASVSQTCYTISDDVRK